MSKVGKVTGRTRQQTLVTAYHEAGHAAMNWQLEMPIKTVTVIPDSDSVGSCVTAKNFLRFTNGELDWSPRAQVNTQKKIMVLLAGAIAQRTYRKSSFRNYHAGSDWHTACDLAVLAP
jgi:ATP-dependent Zn protease